MTYAKTSHNLPALVCSIILHTGLVVWVLYSSFTTMIPQQQMIDISMVAISSPEPKSQPQQAATKSAQTKEPIKIARKPARTSEKNISIVAKISNYQAEKSPEKSSAFTDPIYDAVSLHNAPPPYPASARHKGIEGEVSLMVDVSTEGSAREVSVKNSSGYAVLDEAASDSIRKWHFLPAKRGNETVEANIEIPVKFQLD